MWCSLWAEGLAVYVAAKLNPNADDSALLLTSPVPLRKAVEDHRAEAVCAVRARLDSERGADYGPLFVGGSTPISSALPPRFGYCIGYLVAADLGKRRNLRQLAALTAERARPLIDRILSRLADC